MLNFKSYLFSLKKSKKKFFLFKKLNFNFFNIIIFNNFLKIYQSYKLNKIKNFFLKKKNNNIYLYIVKNFINKNLIILLKNNFYQFLNNCLVKFWIFNLKVKGLGFKIFYLLLKKFYLLKFKIGFSHFIYFLIPLNFKFYFFGKKNKNILMLNFNNINIKNFFFNIYKLRKADIYKGKGLRLVNKKYIFKTGKKPTW